MASRLRITGIVAALYLMTVPVLQAGEIEVRQIRNVVLELTGGSGAGAWRLQYGTNFTPARFEVLAGPGSTAFFSHDNWLRRIDTDKGVVTGRWMFPGLSITDLQWNKGLLRIEVAFAPGPKTQFRRTFDVDPANPEPPPTNQATSDTPQSEGFLGRRRVIRVTEAEKIVSELENAVRRDSFSPWLRIGLANAYALLGKSAESTQMIDEGIRTESAHFMELLEISNYLEVRNARDAARMAFERGYAEFWRRGQDPRLTPMLLFPDSNIRADTPVAVQRDRLDRAYRIGPWVNGASRAWAVYGNALAANGDLQEGMLWQQRAKDAADNGLMITGDEYYFESIAGALVSRACTAAAVLFIAVRYFRYRPQRKARLAAERAAGVSRPGFCNVEYWRPAERWAFLSIIAIAWIAEGVSGTALRAGSNRSFGYFFQVRSGSLLSFNIVDELMSRGAERKERDLLLAMAYQRDGQSQRAKQLYESTPQFAEGWNNLGVLLKNDGDSEGSRRAFEQALQLRPDFPEAEWNLGRPARGEWVKIHEEYVPNKPMLAVPTRDQMLRAFGLSETTLNWREVVRGPLGKGDLANNGVRANWRIREGLLIFLAAGALIIPLLRPREVLVAPPRYLRILELIFPGTARFWGVFGGIVLCAACYASSALWPPIWTREFFYLNYSSSFHRFPLPSSITRGGSTGLLTPIPSYRWFVALMALNAALVLFWNWRRKSPIIHKSAAPSSSG